LAALAPAVQRRLLRHAAAQLGAALDFPATEALRTLALCGKAGQKCELAQGLRAERTPREIRLSVSSNSTSEAAANLAPAEYLVAIPGEIVAPAFSLRLQITTSPNSSSSESPSRNAIQATLRNWKPGDRVQLRHSSSPRKVKEVLERLRVTGSGRAVWPVLELAGRIVWMKGVDLEPVAGIKIFPLALEEAESEPV